MKTRVWSFAASIALIALTGCSGGVAARRMSALGPYRDRPVAMAPLDPAAGEVSQRVMNGAASGLVSGGVQLAEPGTPDALLVSARPAVEALGLKDAVVNEVVNQVGQIAGEPVRKAVALVRVGQLAWELTHLRFALELDEPGRPKPLGGVVWEGARGLDAAASAEKAGFGAGEALAEDIIVQRERWVSRRVAGERMILTPTSLLLEEGELVVSNDEIFIFHAGVGWKRWLQLDLVLGGIPVPAAGGVAYASEAGLLAVGGASFAMVGVFAPGVKIRLLEETETWPGLALSYDMVDLWGGVVGAGGIAFVGRWVAGAAIGGAAGANLQFNVFTLAASKHWYDWLHAGAGAFLIDNHHFMPQRVGVVIGATTGAGGGGTAIVSRFPTITVPYLNVEAAVGDHWRFISEWVMAPGDDFLSLGVRLILYQGKRYGTIRADGFRVKADLAAVASGGSVWPWFGVAIYR